MTEANEDILGQAAQHTRRLIAELEARQADMKSAFESGIGPSKLEAGQRALDATLRAAGSLLAAVDRKGPDENHPSEPASAS